MTEDRITLENDSVHLDFDGHGRLCALCARQGAVRIPIEQDCLTSPFEIQLRAAGGEVWQVAPSSSPVMEKLDHADGQALISTWHVEGEWGALGVRGTVKLPETSPFSEWTLEVENRTDAAVWQVAYPRVGGLGGFGPEIEASGRPDWLAVPFLMGNKAPHPVAFVNQQEKVINSWARNQFGCFDVEGGAGDIAFSYPGMWTMQYLAYGHPATGGIYFAAHDGQALYKRFGMYADGGDGQHAALVMKQYPEDRTALGADFTSFYPVAVGVYEGDWWGASALYRAWALEQTWCRKGPVKQRSDIPDWVKDTDVWYWNWQFNTRGAPSQVVPPIRTLKQRLSCNLAFHWYGYTGLSHDNPYTYPHMYPHDPDVRDAVIRGVQELHELDVHCLPYINTRLWNTNTLSYRKLDGRRWVAENEAGEPADVWRVIGQTVCPTATPFHDVICDINNALVDDVGMDGAYLDQVSGCYAVPCFNKDHDHGPGGHDHWSRGYRQMLQRVRDDMRARKPDSAITSESVIECFLDLLDVDLAREIASLNSSLGCAAALPIPMFHSVYHDYHISYGTVQTFADDNLEAFRYGEALSLVGGGQLMVSGFFEGDDRNEKCRPHLEYMETLIRARMTARRWLNLGEWKPPLTVSCECVSVPFSKTAPPKQDVPAVLSGCYLLDDALCIVLVNHTDRRQKVGFELDGKDVGLPGGRFELATLYPEGGAEPRRLSGRLRHESVLAPCGVHVLSVQPVRE